ncbi:hypothetical protein PG997_006468 [Apiospora hydei]|uniref:Clr5 domain-containing protein n=1 Tax=Apiospora hydei TaxID=1337664 RepID=A0ABR1WNZ5_9PEZI
MKNNVDLFVSKHCDSPATKVLIRTQNGQNFSQLSNFLLATLANPLNIFCNFCMMNTFFRTFRNFHLDQSSTLVTRVLLGNGLCPTLSYPLGCWLKEGESGSYPPKSPAGLAGRFLTLYSFVQAPLCTTEYANLILVPPTSGNVAPMMDDMADDFWNPFTPGLNRETEFHATFAGNTSGQSNDHSSSHFIDSFDFINNNFFDEVFDPIIDDAQLPDVVSLPPLETPLVPPLYFGNQLSEPNPAPPLYSGQAAQQSQVLDVGITQGAVPKPRQKGPTASDWNRQKPKIRELYFEENHTLEKTRTVMSDDHSFDASINLYKQKFQEWGWQKNLPQSWTPKMVRLAEERRPKDTVFQLGPKKWTMQEVKRKREKSNNDIEFCAFSRGMVMNPTNQISRLTFPAIRPYHPHTHPDFSHVVSNIYWGSPSVVTKPSFAIQGHIKTMESKISPTSK